MSTSEQAIIRVSLQGQYQTSAGLKKLQHDMRNTGSTAHLMGDQMEGAGKRGFIMNQALFTVRRGLYAGTLALAAMTVGVIGFGLKFNANMQQNRVAFTHFLGDAQLAETYLDRLYTLAATTPFEFQQLTTATKKLLAFGYSGEGAYRTMVTIGDAAAGIGSGVEGIDRMTLAFGQMMSNGRILGGELRQLAEAGVNARKYLSEAGLVPAGTANIGDLNIPAAVGIEAILRGMEKEFGGFAAKQSKTFTGLLSTIHDYAQKLFGTITLPLFTKLSDTILPRIVTLTKSLEEGFAAGGWGGMMAALDGNIGAGGNLILVWERLDSIGRSLAVIVRASADAWIFALKVFSPLLLLLWPISWALKAITGSSTILTSAFKILLVWFIALKIWSGALYVSYFILGIAIRVYTMWTKRAVYWTAVMTTITKIQVMWSRRYRLIIWGMIAAQIAYAAVTRAAAIATVAMTIAMMTNPFGWIAIAVALLVIGLYMLIMHWDWVKEKLVSLYNWVSSHWYVLFGVPFIGPVILAVGVIIRNFDKIRTAIDWLIEKIKDLIGWFDRIKPSWSWLTPGFDMPGFGTDGGTFSQRSGIVPPSTPIAGRRPNLREAQPSRFNPDSFGNTQRAEPLQVTVPVVIDGKNVAEATANYNLYREARR